MAGIQEIAPTGFLGPLSGMKFGCPAKIAEIWLFVHVETYLTDV